jgi:hypothetical protein
MSRCYVRTFRFLWKTFATRSCCGKSVDTAMAEAWSKWGSLQWRISLLRKTGRGKLRAPYQFRLAVQDNGESDRSINCIERYPWLSFLDLYWFMRCKKQRIFRAIIDDLLNDLHKDMHINVEFFYVLCWQCLFIRKNLKFCWIFVSHTVV